VPYKPRKGGGWRYGIGAVWKLQVRPPPASSNSSHSDSQLASTTNTTIYYYGMYRPRPDPAELQHILNHTDVLLFDHGLHWNDFGHFQDDMTHMLQQAYSNHDLALLVWRQTSAQHFSTPGGYYRRRREGDKCVPINHTDNQDFPTIMDGEHWEAMHAAATNTSFRSAERVLLCRPNKRADLKKLLGTMSARKINK
jgi:hypothetical protein